MIRVAVPVRSSSTSEWLLAPEGCRSRSRSTGVAVRFGVEGMFRRWAVYLQRSIPTKQKAKPSVKFKCQLREG